MATWIVINNHKKYTGLNSILGNVFFNWSNRLFVRNDLSCCSFDQTDLIPQNITEYKSATHIIRRLLNRNNSLLFSNTILRSTFQWKKTSKWVKFRHSDLDQKSLKCGLIPPPGGYLRTIVLLFTRFIINLKQNCL